MPLHDYYCTKCDRVFEILVRSDRLDEPIKCPGCGEALKKRIAPVRILRYGNG